MPNAIPFVPKQIAAGNFSDVPVPAGGDVGKALVWNTTAFAYTAFEASGAVANHAALTSGVHGITSFAATLLDDTSASVARTTLGLGTIATDSQATYLAATGATTGATSQVQAFTLGIKAPSIQPSSDSTTAVRVFKADGSTAVITIDTTNSRILVAPGSSTNLAIADSTNTNSGFYFSGSGASGQLNVYNNGTQSASFQSDRVLLPRSLLVIGASNEIYVPTAYTFQFKRDSASVQAQTLIASGGSGTNIAGSNLILAGGKGTGSANGGDLLFQVAPAGGSGSSQNALSTKLQITGAGNIGVFNATPVAQQTITGSRGGNAALASFLTAMAAFGWIVDSTSA